MRRRTVLKTLGAISGTFFPDLTFGNPIISGDFKYCLHTSTLGFQKIGIEQAINIAARSGFDSIEAPIVAIKKYCKQGGSIYTLKKLLRDSNLTLENVSDISPWMVNDDQQRD